MVTNGTATLGKVANSIKQYFILCNFYVGAVNWRIRRGTDNNKKDLAAGTFWWLR